MLTPEQIDALLNEPLYGWNSLTLLGDIEDFPDFSEANIEWRAKRELRAVVVDCNRMEFEDSLDAARYREHRIETDGLARTIHDPTAADADMAENARRARCACSTYCQVRLRALRSAPPRVFGHLDALASRDHE